MAMFHQWTAQASRRIIPVAHQRLTFPKVADESRLSLSLLETIGPPRTIKDFLCPSATLKSNVVFHVVQ